MGWEEDLLRLQLERALQQEQELPYAIRRAAPMGSQQAVAGSGKDASAKVQGSQSGAWGSVTNSDDPMGLASFAKATGDPRIAQALAMYHRSLGLNARPHSRLAEEGLVGAFNAPELSLTNRIHYRGGGRGKPGGNLGNPLGGGLRALDEFNYGRDLVRSDLEAKRARKNRELDLLMEQRLTAQERAQQLNMLKALFGGPGGLNLKERATTVGQQLVNNAGHWVPRTIRSTTTRDRTGDVIQLLMSLWT